jgi:hypothetical protein
VPSEACAVTDGLDVGVITGIMLPTFNPGTAEVETAEAVGLGAPIGTPTGLDGPTVTVTVAPGAAGGAAGRDDGWGALGAPPRPVTVTMPTACALVTGFVNETAEAVRLTHAAPLDGVRIPALRVSNDGMTSVPSDPSWHEAPPLPLGQKPVNVTLPADAVSATDTFGTVPFNASTCTVKRASRPRATLLSEACTLTHSITVGAVGDAEADGRGDGVAPAGSG